MYARFTVPLLIAEFWSSPDMSIFNGASNVTIAGENITFSQGNLEEILMSRYINNDRSYPTRVRQRSSIGDSQDNHGPFFHTDQGG